MSVSIIGVGLHPFGRFDISGREMGLIAARAALADAGLAWSDIDFAAGGSRDGGHADALVSELGLTGVPFISVYNGCGTGGSALLTASQAIESGAADIALAVGFDKHARGAFATDPSEYGLPDWYAEAGMMVTTQFFALKLRRYLDDHGLDPRLLAEVAAKALRNGSITPHAWRRNPFTADEIANAPMVNDPLTTYMFCSPSEGGAAIVLTSTERAREMTDRSVELRAIEFRSRQFGTFEVFSPSLAPTITPGATVDASRAAFESAGIGPDEIDVAQIQDTEAGAELMHLAECGFCEHGEQGKLILGGELDIDGRIPVNTDGGLIANGEPIGASGLRQVIECVRQLQGRAGDRQVPGEPRIAFTQVYGAPGISACTVLSR
ncbi:MAG TPA: thiolase family protein [Acidimicrobiales bacterium]|nr:thiolase family protein [Acidimicrobiales bacterium]